MSSGFQSSFQPDAGFFRCSTVPYRWKRRMRVFLRSFIAQGMDEHDRLRIDRRRRRRGIQLGKP